MIRLLKTNTPANYLLMFVLMIILWGFKLIYVPTAIEEYEYPSLLFSSFPKTIFFQYLSAILSFALFYAIGLLIIKINSDLIIVESAHQSPGIIYAIFTGFFINSQRITPATIAGLLLFLSIVIILYSYKKFNAPENCYNAGLIYGVALLLNPKFVAFFPLIVVVLFMTKAVNWREIVILLMGIITPLLLFFSFIWLYGNVTVQIEKISLFFTQSFNATRYNSFNVLVLLVPIFWSITAILSKYSINVLNKVSTRKLQNICVLSSFVFMLFFSSPFSDNESITLLYPFSSILISNVFVNAKRRTSIFFLFGILTSIILSQIFQISFYLSVF